MMERMERMERDEQDTIIATRNLSRTYIMGKMQVTALNRVTLDIRRGEFAATSRHADRRRDYDRRGRDIRAVGVGQDDVSA